MKDWHEDQVEEAAPCFLLGNAAETILFHLAHPHSGEKNYNIVVRMNESQILHYWWASIAPATSSVIEEVHSPLQESCLLFVNWYVAASLSIRAWGPAALVRSNTHAKWHQKRVRKLAQWSCEILSKKRRIKEFQKMDDETVARILSQNMNRFIINLTKCLCQWMHVPVIKWTQIHRWTTCLDPPSDDRNNNAINSFQFVPITEPSLTI